MTIAIYHDEGSGAFSRACLTAALAAKGPVRRIRAAEICASDAWHRDTTLLAFPGGADRPYMTRLNGAGSASIQRYLEGGGALLGVCAGAYFVSARIAFEAGTPGEILGTRELALFAGTARGSLHDLAEPYALDHLRCASVARVQAHERDQDLYALYWGGPELQPDAGASYRPLLRYVSLDGRERLAAVRVDVGAGRAVLTGVHAEVTGAQFPIEVSQFPDASFEHGMRVAAELTRREPERAQLFDLLYAALTD